MNFVQVWFLSDICVRDILLSTLMVFFFNSVISPLLFSRNSLLMSFASSSFHKLDNCRLCRRLSFLGHDYFVQHLFQFILHHLLYYLFSLSTLSCFRDLFCLIQCYENCIQVYYISHDVPVPSLSSIFRLRQGHIPVLATSLHI